MPKLSLPTISVGLLLLLGPSLVFPKPSEAAKISAGTAGLSSLLLPGLGQALSGNPLEGLGWFATSLGLLFIPTIGSNMATDIWFYSSYDAYRDNQPKNGDYKDHNVFQNYLGNFNPLNIVDPIGGPIVAYGVYASSGGATPAEIFNPSNIIRYTFVGLGEEALFRGFLYPGISDLLFGSKIAGAIVSSAIFGAVHFQYNTSKRVTVAVMGLLFCIQASLNEFDLRKNIFAHSWFDVFVGPAYDNRNKSSVNTKNTLSDFPGIKTGVRIHF